MTSAEALCIEGYQSWTTPAEEAEILTLYCNTMLVCMVEDDKGPSDDDHDSVPR